MAANGAGYTYTACILVGRQKNEWLHCIACQTYKAPANHIQLLIILLHAYQMWAKAIFVIFAVFSTIILNHIRQSISMAQTNFSPSIVASYIWSYSFIRFASNGSASFPTQKHTHTHWNILDASLSQHHFTHRIIFHSFIRRSDNLTKRSSSISISMAIAH